MEGWTKADTIEGSAFERKPKCEARKNADVAIMAFIESGDDMWVHDFADEIEQAKINGWHGCVSDYMTPAASHYRSAAKSNGVKVRTRGTKLYIIKGEQ